MRASNNKEVIFMLIQFSFRNFRSFREDTTIDMTASDIPDRSFNLIEASDGKKYLKTAAIYGANASGKSNIIKAFDFMQQFVCNSLMMGGIDIRHGKKQIPITGFFLDRNSRNETSEFEVFFLGNDKEYQYGFVIDREMIHKEWLYIRKKDEVSFETLFERNESQITFGDNMKDCEKFIDAVEDQTLFLTLTAKLKVRHSIEVYSWFYNNIIIDFGDSNHESLYTKFIPGEKLKKEEYKKKFEEFLSAIDTGIKGFRVEEKIIKDESSSEPSYKLYTIHKTENNEGNQEIDFNDESSGTQKMFFLFEYFMDAIERGSVIFIDELDAKLHPLLLRYIINMFHDHDSNKNNAQLIYSTHDMYTLTKDIFRRDQIWFTEKDANGASNLFSLLEYMVDDKSTSGTTSINKDYVTGRYGAIPLLKEFKILEVE
jgi:AAA15 family ATPase/GTPase